MMKLKHNEFDISKYNGLYKNKDIILRLKGQAWLRRGQPTTWLKRTTWPGLCRPAEWLAQSAFISDTSNKRSDTDPGQCCQINPAYLPSLSELHEFARIFTNFRRSL